MRNILLTVMLLFIGNVFGQWTQLGDEILGASDGSTIGYSLDLSDDGTVVAIGSGGGNYVSVHKWDGVNWNIMGDTIAEKISDEIVGYSVSLSGDGSILAIGVKNGKVAGIGYYGNIRIYEWSGSTWVQKGTDMEGTYVTGYLGWSVDINYDGTVVVGGANNFRVNGVNRAGRARVFEWDGGTSDWVQRGSGIDGSTMGFSYNISDYFGEAASINDAGDIVAVGARGRDTLGLTDCGEARVFKWDGSAWSAHGGVITGIDSYERFGEAISLSSSGDTLAIGGDLGGGVNQYGVTRVYYYDTGVWTQVGTDILGTEVGERSSFTIALSGNGKRVVVGSKIYSPTISGFRISEVGRTKSYEWNGTAWVQYGITIDGANLQDNEGTGVAISYDGEVVASGAYRYDSLIGGRVGNDGGRVRIYGFENVVSYVNTTQKNSFLIYPNPVKDVLTVVYGSERIDANTIQLFNALGQEVRLPFIQKESTLEFNVSKLEKGIYFLKYFNVKEENYKFIIQ